MSVINALARIGAATRGQLAATGYAFRLFVRLWVSSVQALKRFGLVRDQVHFLGNHSLSIITVSGLFVGFVLGLQGYYTLQRYGSSEALGLLEENIREQRNELFRRIAPSTASEALNFHLTSGEELGNENKLKMSRPNGVKTISTSLIKFDGNSLTMDYYNHEENTKTEITLKSHI